MFTKTEQLEIALRRTNALLLSLHADGATLIERVTHHTKPGETRHRPELHVDVTLPDHLRQQTYFGHPTTAEFHAHLDACVQCREHPMELCQTGADLIQHAAR